jgi:uncharacterized protein YigA (DUF484 family)
MRKTMTSGNQTNAAEAEALYARLRDRIIAEPDVILNDMDVMRALVAANERSMGGNIVDLRGVAMQRLEARLNRLEDTHRSVIAAAYDNLAGANQVHRATLALMEPADFEGFLRVLETEVPSILQVDRIRLALETRQSEGAESVARFANVLSVVEPGFVEAYIDGRRNLPARAVTLRQGEPADARLYGDDAGWVKSEALMRLDLGEGRLPGLLALGSEDPHQFKPGQGTDLLGYFCAIFERALRRWLS